MDGDVWVYVLEAEEIKLEFTFKDRRTRRRKEVNVSSILIKF